MSRPHSGQCLPRDCIGSMPHLCPQPLGESLVWLEPSSPALGSLGLLVLVKTSVVLSYSFCSFVCLSDFQRWTLQSSCAAESETVRAHPGRVSGQLAWLQAGRGPGSDNCEGTC